MTPHPDGPVPTATPTATATPTEAAAAGSTSVVPAVVPDRGATIGRFVVLDVLGEGGMGVVVSAYDPKLDRRVALKLLRRGGVALGSARMLREAQAMARLAHPHVVTVHEVLGGEGEPICIVMEYVAGRTLRAWQGEQRRSWREILALYRQAGEGLAAAHRAMLVHRDFKPDNVLVGTDGRARVSDFGIVAAAGDVLTAADLGASGSPDAFQSTLTQTGSWVGTPAYAPPEQLEGQPTDARSDQFSFCAALYVALYGVRPFAGDTHREQLEAKRAERITEPPASNVPAFVRAALVRGLRARPEARFPSMDALLRTLARDPGATRRRALGIAAAVLVAAAGIWGLTRGTVAAEPCGGARERLAGAWDPITRASVEAAFAATGRVYARDTFTRFAGRLDDYSGAWVAMRTDACRATRVRGDQSEALLDLRMACLERRRGALAALVEVMARADADVLDKAVEAASKLESLDGCADTAALTARVPPPPDPIVAGQVQALHTRLDRAEALRAAGKFKDALALAGPLLTEAEATAHAPVRARVHSLLGALYISLDDADAAERHSMTAIQLAAEAHEDALESRTAANLASCYVDLKKMYPQALVAARMAEAAARRAGDELLVGEAQLAASWALDEMGRNEEELALVTGVLASFSRFMTPDDPRMLPALIRGASAMDAAGKFDEARALGERALALARRSLGEEHPRVANVLNNLGVIANGQGKLHESVAFYEQSLALKEKVFGPEHTQVALALNNLSGAVDRLGETDRAAALAERALAIRERASGPKHPSLGTTLGNLGAVRIRQGRFAEAQELLERALAIAIETSGPDSTKAATRYFNLGEVFRVQRRFDEARAYYAKSAAARKKSLGAEHADYGYALHITAVSYVDEKRCGEARPLLDEAARILIKALGADNPEVARVLASQGACAVIEHRPADAIPLLERALVLMEKGRLAADDLGPARFDLARALWDSGRDRARALVVLDTAEKELVAGKVPSRRKLAELRAWRKAHR